MEDFETDGGGVDQSHDCRFRRRCVSAHFKAKLRCNIGKILRCFQAGLSRGFSRTNDRWCDCNLRNGRGEGEVSISTTSR
jgi:hypothetical protein